MSAPTNPATPATPTPAAATPAPATPAAATPTTGTAAGAATPAKTATRVSLLNRIDTLAKTIEGDASTEIRKLITKLRALL